VVDLPRDVLAEQIVEGQKVVEDLQVVRRVRDPLGEQLAQQTAIRVAHRERGRRLELQPGRFELDGVHAQAGRQDHRDRHGLLEGGPRDDERVGPDAEAAARWPDRLRGRVVGQVRALEQPRRPEQRADEIARRRGGLGRDAGRRAVAAGGSQPERAHEEHDHQKTSGLHRPSFSSRAWGVRRDSGGTAGEPPLATEYNL